MAHHFKSSADVSQGDMRFVVVRGGESGAVVLHDDLDRRTDFPRRDRDVDGLFALPQSVHDGILHDGLQSQGRNAEMGDGRVERDEEAVLKLRLFHGEIGAGVFQFLRERNALLARDGGEVFPKVGREVQCDLFRLFRVLIAKVIDAHHRVVDEMRAHLQHHNARFLVGDLLLSTHIFLHVVRENQRIHNDGKKRHTRDNEHLYLEE